MGEFDVRDEREPGHFWADNEVYDHYGKRIGPTGLAVYMGLCRYSKAGVSWPSIRRLADDLGIKSEQTVRKALATLKDVGLIRIEERPADSAAKRGTQTHRFFILKVEKDKRDVKDVAGGGANNIPPPANNAPQGVNLLHPNKTYKNKTQGTSGGVESSRLSAQDAAAAGDQREYVSRLIAIGLTPGQAKSAVNKQEFTPDIIDRLTELATRLDLQKKNPAAIIWPYLEAGKLPKDMPPPKVADWKPRKPDGSIDYDRWNALIKQDRRWQTGPVL